MKTAFRITVLLAALSGTALLLQLFGVLTFSVSNLTLFATGVCGSGILALAIHDYTPRRRRRLARRTLPRENAAPGRTAEAAAATWGYHTMSA